MCVRVLVCMYLLCVCSKRPQRRLTTAHRKEGGCSTSIPDPIVIAKNELEKQSMDMPFKLETTSGTGRLRQGSEFCPPGEASEGIRVSESSRHCYCAVGLSGEHDLNSVCWV